ncbi:MAG: TonB-dependent receptor [Parvularculaceae bacterium]|nr:TonB-dependent receptor [Parvularculaceae bacterium]
MTLKGFLAAGAAAVALSVSIAAPAIAQTVTSSVRGTVTSDTGAGVAGATVIVTDTRTGTRRTVRTNSDGSFSVPNLETGGPYTVEVDTDQYQDQTVQDVYIDLGNRTVLTINLGAAAGAPSDEIVVTAARSVQQDLAIGPNTTFGQEQLTGLPSIGRDIRDVIRLDPRIRIDGTNSDAVQCVGSNNRFNSFTIDGVRNADSFGLNNSGFQSRAGLPLPFDSIRETTVEFAPFDVEYGQFTGCNINVVTKSGGNDFSGSGFATFSSQKLTGSTLEGNEVGRVPFKDYRWGATFSGPIIKDRLFFFGGYEEYKLNRTQDTGPLGGGFANERIYATQTQVDAIASALEARGIPTSGGTLSVLPRQSRRILGRVDWNINDDHRIAATYARLREFSTFADDFSSSNNLIALGSTFYKSGTESETYSVRLFSQWTDRLSTELRVSRADINDIQDPLGGGEAQDGNPIPRVIVGITNDFNGNSVIDANERGGIVAGPGFSRSANKLVTQLDAIKFKADYELGDHTLTWGYELDQGDYYNIFAQNATGTLVFQNLTALNAGQLTLGTNTNTSGANIFDNTASGAYTNASFTGDFNDAAAIFSRAIHSTYLQDEWRMTDALTAVIGLRYDWYSSSDEPKFNPNFVTRYGFDNQQAYDGLKAWLPRLGFTYDADETLFGTTTFRMGAGVFTGGDPTVWFSNSYSNPGNTLVGPFSSARRSSGSPCTVAEMTLPAGPLAVPGCLTAASIAEAVASDGRTDAVDPNFKLPKVIRANFGFTHNTDFGGALGGFFDDWTAQIDVLYTRGWDSVDFVDVSLDQIGTAIDGRPIYQVVDRLRNAGCTAVPTGNVRDPFTNVNAACSGNQNQASQDSIVLTNALQGNRAFTVSGAFSKGFDFDSPLLKKPASLDVNLGYAFTDAEDTSPATSSVSTSNYRSVSTDALNAMSLATSNYETKHNVTASFRYSEEFFKDLETKFNFFFQARSGQPFSLTFNNTGAFGDTSSGGGSQRQLLYIPTGPTDPNVTFGAGFNQAAFFAFLERVGAMKYAGQIAPRNAFKSGWFIDADFRFEQDLPRIAGIRPQMYVDIENFPNLFSDEANILRQVGFPQNANIVTIGNAANPNTGAGSPRFQYNGFAVSPSPFEGRNVDESVWQASFGLRFEF